MTTQAQPSIRADPAASRRRSTASSTIIVMAATGLSAVLGFGREIITAHYYGTRSEVDAFLNASTVPLVLFGIFNGSLVGALVPTFTDYASRGRDDEVRKLGSTVINGLFFLMVALAALGWLLAPVFVPIVAHGFPPEKQQLEVRMVRWLMPGIIATTLSGVCTALLNSNHRFLSSALVTVAANIATIGFVISLHLELGIFALVLGSVAGVFAQLLIQLPSILKNRLYQFYVDFRHPGLARAGALFFPVTLGSGAWQINLGFDRYFASTLASGSTAGLGYTTKLAFLPILVIAGAIGTVIFPLIAGQFANSDKEGMRRSISLALRMVSFIVIPCAAGLIALAYPLVQTLFERGAFGPASTAFCASAIPFACVPLVAISYNQVLLRACYACKEMRLSVTSSFVIVGLNIGLSAAFLPFLGAGGLLLANGLAAFVGTIFLIVVLWRVTDGLEWQTLLSSLCRVTLAAVVMASTLFWIRSLGFAPATTLISRASNLAVLLGAAALVYVGASRIFRIEELMVVTRAIRSKLPRRDV